MQKLLAERSPEDRVRLMEWLEKWPKDLSVNPSALMEMMIAKEKNDDRIVVNFAKTRKAKFDEDRKRNQAMMEKSINLLGESPFKIPDDVTAELDQLAEDQDKEAHIDKTSQRRAELTLTQTRSIILDRALDILQNQPHKQAPIRTQQKTKTTLHPIFLGSITKDETTEKGTAFERLS